MIKTIKIGEKNVVLNNNIGWTLIYKDQFGRDIIPALMPVAQSVIDIIAGVVEETGKTNNIGVQDLAKAADNYKVMEAFAHLSGLEFVEVINILWSLAKNADDSIPEPKIWIKEFDDFYLDEIVPEVAKLIGKGVVSSKNLSRLQTKTKALEPKKKSTSTSKK